MQIVNMMHHPCGPRVCRCIWRDAPATAQFCQCLILLTPSAIDEAPLGLASTGESLFNRKWTLLGVPCVHLPTGKGPQGLPLGVQVVGRRGSDVAVLRAAHWVENVLARRGGLSA